MSWIRLGDDVRFIQSFDRDEETKRFAIITGRKAPSADCREKVVNFSFPHVGTKGGVTIHTHV